MVTSNARCAMLAFRLGLEKPLSSATYNSGLTLHGNSIMNERLLASAPLLLASLIGCSTSSAPGEESQHSPQIAASQSTLEEDFQYPGADQIFADRNIRLQTGDGKLLLVDCAAHEDRITVWSRASNSAYCFWVRGSTGYVSMQLPTTYLIFKDKTHSLEVTSTQGAALKVETVPSPDDVLGLGESGTTPEKGPATLLKLRAFQ